MCLINLNKNKLKRRNGTKGKNNEKEEESLSPKVPFSKALKEGENVVHGIQTHDLGAFVEPLIHRAKPILCFQEFILIYIYT